MLLCFVVAVCPVDVSGPCAIDSINSRIGAFGHVGGFAFVRFGFIFALPCVEWGMSPSSRHCLMRVRAVL